MKQWATMSKNGQTSATLDQKVILAHDKYRAACAVTQAALVAYKQSGDQTAYVQGLVTARATAQAVIDLIIPLLSTKSGVKLQTDLQKARGV